ncbi:MAG: UDP-3-O-(3-hydroxymyristoyl)glucosamine N-acyltransferase [Flavobacteriales bacterium]|nr:UDP-3-O-(3-hydroxymyristoyl)glucosamine N-acyltransferase [Flavobacteriales bacterium]
MEFTAQQVAELLNGTVEGNPDVTISKLAKIEEGVTHSLTFLSNDAYTEFIYSTDASAAIVQKDFVAERPLKNTLTLIRVEDPRISFGKLLEAYQQFRFNYTGTDAQASVDKTAKLGENVYVGPNATVSANTVIGKNSKIGANCFIGDSVKIGENTSVLNGAIIHHDCEIGNHCVVYSGVVIGGDGFGFAPNSENNYQKVVHIGNVILEDYVEIGTNTTIDRGTLGSTIIRKGVKLDNLIQVAHNVEIGENTVIAAQTGIAGSTKIGKNCMVGGQVGFVGHITIANGVKIAAQSGIGNSITEENSIWQGSPAIAVRDFQRSYVVFRKLPELMQRLGILEKKLS